MGDVLRSTALPRFLLLYTTMYAAFGVASPFLPALVSARGLPAAQLGLVLSAGTAVRLLTAPLAGRLGDVIQGLRVVRDGVQSNDWVLVNGLMSVRPGAKVKAAREEIGAPHDNAAATAQQ